MRNVKFLLLLCVLGVLFIIINVIDWTSHPRRSEFDYFELNVEGEEIRPRDAQTSAAKQAPTFTRVGQRSSVQPRPRTQTGENPSKRTNVANDGGFKSLLNGEIAENGGDKPAVLMSGNKTQTKLNISQSATKNTDANVETFNKTLNEKPKLVPLTRLTSENKQSVNGTPEEDHKQKRKRLQQTNPLYSDRVINPHPYYFINNSDTCGQHAPDGKVFLLILVACRPEEDKDRRLIRDTWGGIKAYRGKPILTRFLVGRSWKKYGRRMVVEERTTYGDIIQENFVDSYRNMTHKVLMGLKWAARMCPNASYVMNLDSDMFVNVFRLVMRLEGAPRSNFAEGNRKGVTVPIRKRAFAKWYTPVELYPESTYPPYLNGPAYVMSGDLPSRIFNESAHVRYLPWDDVYIGLVMKKLALSSRRGNHYEEYPNRWYGLDAMKSISNGIASYVDHQRAYNLVLRDIWRKVLEQYDSYVYSPPPDSILRLNNASLRHW